MLRRGIHDRDLSTVKLPVESDVLEPNELQPIAPDRRPAMQDVMGLHVVAEGGGDRQNFRSIIR